MRYRLPLPHIGLRTVKTTVAIVISMALVHIYGTTDSKYIFAMLGAMGAMENTFQDSLEACLTQLVGVSLNIILRAEGWERWISCVFQPEGMGYEVLTKGKS